jgi:hypothetical protein
MVGQKFFNLLREKLKRKRQRIRKRVKQRTPRETRSQRSLLLELEEKERRR